MASSDAKPIPQKNVAYRITFPILDADGDLVTGAASLDSEISKDGGTFADCTNEATEIATSSGVYFLDLTSTEMNADCVAIIVKTLTAGAKTTTIILYPEEVGDIRVNITQMTADTVTASSLAANAVTEIQNGLMTSSMDVDGKTFQEFCRLVGAVLLGKASGMNTTSGIFRALNDSKPRVTASLDGNGNRIVITLDAS